MPKNNETKFGKFENYFNLPNPGLRSYFDIVQKGQPEEYRTTFAKGETIEEVLKAWQPHVESLTEQWPTLVEFENDLKAKVGPMSIMKPLSERMEDIDHYYDDILLSSTPVSDKALKAVLAEFKAIKGLRVRGQQRTCDLMKKSTNSGSPYFTKRRNVVKKTLYCDVDPGRNQGAGIPFQILNCNVDSWSTSGLHPAGCATSTDYLACAVLGWRGQEGGPTKDDVKQRVVWMFPFAVNICELQVYQPLIESCQKFNLVPAWVSMESVDQRITNMFDTKGVDDLVICTDFSKFDQHFNEDMQQAAACIIEGLLSDDRSSKSWIRQVFPIKFVIPLAYNYNQIRFGKHGMGSGSGGTNADETLAHRALQYEAALANNAKLNPNSQCLGDDGVLTYPGITVEDVVHSYTSHGQEMNESKQYASKQDCIYLRRWHHMNYRQDGICVGVYSTYRALGRLMEQERYYDPEVWSNKMVALRQLSIIENVKYHPLRDQFAEFCMKRDKYRLGIDIPGFLDNIDSIAEEAIDLMPDFLGYTKSMTKEQTGLSN
uniref:Putative RNA-dependent RNA polymerase n=1 Tax=Dromedary picobirnavirus TaxID=1574421 RepID=A0A0A1EIT7_9VIRU|nr:putative RNA-dependent RNA polymerase [Dromedary picobirnavirus]